MLAELAGCPVDHEGRQLAQVTPAMARRWRPDGEILLSNGGTAFLEPGSSRVLVGTLLTRVGRECVILKKG